VLLFCTVANVAYITGYLVSFVSNFFLTSYFTFRTKPTLKRFIGFSGSHAINFGLHVVLFNIFLWLGVHQLVIPLLVIGIAMMVQFFILRLVFTKKAE
jgi:putative flippase GtrA